MGGRSWSFFGQHQKISCRDRHYAVHYRAWNLRFSLSPSIGFPHALVTCASAIESAMKSALAIDPEEFINAKKLYAKAINHFKALALFDESAKQGGQVFILDRFRPSVKNEDPYVFLNL